MDKPEAGETKSSGNINIINDKVTKSGKKSTSAASGEYIPLATFEEQRPSGSTPSSPSFVIDIPASKKKNSNSFSDNQPLMSYRGESGSSSSRKAATSNNNENGGDSQVSVDMKYSKGSPINSANAGGIIGVPAPVRKGFWARWFGKRVPQARSFPLNETSQAGFPPNKIRNQKYHAYSFIFVVLFNQVYILMRVE